MKMIKLCGFILICAVTSLIIKDNGSKSISIFIFIFGIISSAICVVSDLGQVVKEINAVTASFGVSRHTSMVLKCFGISFISEIAFDSLKDLGAESLGKWLVIAAKAEMLVLIFPFVLELIESGLSLL